MHGGMPCDPIQGQGHKDLETKKSSTFLIYLLRLLQWELANDH